ISTNGADASLDIQTESAAIARRIFTLLKQVFTGPVELLVRKKMSLKKNNIYIVRVKEEANNLLQTLDIEHEGDGFEQTDLLMSLKTDGCRRAYLPGAFVALGSV